MAKSLTPRGFVTLLAINKGTRAEPIYSWNPPNARLHRGMADTLVRHGLAKFRGFDGKTRGGYYITKKGRDLLSEYMDGATP